MREQERADFLASLIQPTVEDAYERGDTLTLVRPREVVFRASEKTNSEILNEEKAYSTAASQFSFLTESKKPIDPCPFKFTFTFKMDDSKKRNYTCDDWETSAMFFRWRRDYGQAQTLKMMKEKFEGEYPDKGMVFALGTHSLRPKQWLLVGVIRLNETSQAQLF